MWGKKHVVVFLFVFLRLQRQHNSPGRRGWRVMRSSRSVSNEAPNNEDPTNARNRSPPPPSLRRVDLMRTAAAMLRCATPHCFRHFFFRSGQWASWHSLPQ